MILELDVHVENLDELSNNCATMFENREHDNILTVSVNEQEYPAHKNILSSASSYLR